MDSNGARRSGDPEERPRAPLGFLGRGVAVDRRDAGELDLPEGRRAGQGRQRESVVDVAGGGAERDVRIDPDAARIGLSG